MKLLFVCTGNTCRSPMAEALARLLLDKMGRDDIIVESAGIFASGEEATAAAVGVMAECGMDIQGRRSRQLTVSMCCESDVIAVMTLSHASIVHQQFKVPREKIRLLGDGIPDPFGGDVALYRQTRNVLLQAVTTLLETLAQ